MSENNSGGLAERGGGQGVQGSGDGSAGSSGSNGSRSNVGSGQPGRTSNVRSAYPSRSTIGQPGTTYKFGWQPEYVSDTMSPDEWYGATHPAVQNEGHIALDNQNGWSGNVGDLSHFSSNPHGAGGDNSGQGGMGAGALTNRAGYGGGIGADNPMSPGFAERQAAARLNRAEAGGDRPIPPGVGGLQQPPRPVQPPLSGGRGGEGGHVKPPKLPMPPHIRPPHIRPPHTPGPRNPRPGGGAGGFGGFGGRSLSDIAGGGQIRRFAQGGHLPGYADGGHANGLGLVGDRTGNVDDMELIDAPGGASITPVMDDDGDNELRDSAVRHITAMLFGGKKGGYSGGPRKGRASGNDHGDRASFHAADASMRRNNSNNQDGGGGSGPPDNDGTGHPRGFGNEMNAGNTEAPPPGNPRGFFGGVHRVKPPQTAGFAFSRPRPMGNPNGTGSRVPGISMNLGNYRPSGNQGQGGSGPDDDNASGLGVSGGPGPWG